MGEGRAALDISVMPLIAGSDYRELIDLTSGVQLEIGSADPHDSTIAHWVMALNRESDAYRSIGSMASSMVPGLSADPLGWVGEAIGLYADKDPFWAELANSEDWEQHLMENWPHIPVAFVVEVESSLGLAAFLTALRTFTNQAAPGMTLWENRKHLERDYVRIAASPDFADGEPEDSFLHDLALYYASMPGILVFSFREDVIHHAIERHGQRKAGDTEFDQQNPWLGTSLALRLDQQIFHTPMFWEDSRQDIGSWVNLPILNEWHRLYPDRDPMAVHEELWHTRLLCPGGGEYVWNEEWQTMESTVYGHPWNPKLGPRVPLGLLELLHADFGLSFEADGLRASAVLQR